MLLSLPLSLAQELVKHSSSLSLISLHLGAKFGLSFVLLSLIPLHPGVLLFDRLKLLPDWVRQKIIKGCILRRGFPSATYISHD